MQKQIAFDLLNSTLPWLVSIKYLTCCKLKWIHVVSRSSQQKPPVLSYDRIEESERVMCEKVVSFAFLVIPSKQIVLVAAENTRHVLGYPGLCW